MGVVPRGLGNPASPNPGLTFWAQRCFDLPPGRVAVAEAPRGETRGCGQLMAAKIWQGGRGA